MIRLHKYVPRLVYLALCMTCENGDGPGLHQLLYTPANLLAIETLLQFKQVDCEFDSYDSSTHLPIFLICRVIVDCEFDSFDSSTHLPIFWPSRLYCSSIRLIVNSLSWTSEHLQLKGKDPDPVSLLMVSTRYRHHHYCFIPSKPF